MKTAVFLRSWPEWRHLGLERKRTAVFAAYGRHYFRAPPFTTSALPLLAWLQWWSSVIVHTSNICLLTILFFYFHTAIFLGSLKLPHTEVKKLILKCDQEVLKESAINSLLKYLPSPEQVRHKTNNQTNKSRWEARKLFWSNVAISRSKY